MGKKKREAQRKDLKKLSEATVGPKVTVVAIADISALAPSTFAQQRKVAEEVRLVRSALLYAGNVELISPAVARLERLTKLACSIPEGLVEILEMHHRDPNPEALELDPQRLRETLQMAKEMLTFRKTHTRAQIRQSPELQQAKKVYDQVLGLSYDSLASGVRRQYDEYWRVYGGKDLEEAISRGVLTCHNDVFFRDEMASDLDLERISTYVDGLLRDPSAHLLFDDLIRRLGQERVEKNRVTPSTQTMKNSARAGAGTRFVEHLPVFPDASMEDILKARLELAELRGRYYRGIRSVQEKIASSPLDADFLPEVDQYWRDCIHPIAAEMAAAASQTVKSAEVVYLPFDKTSSMTVSGTGTSPMVRLAHATS